MTPASDAATMTQPQSNGDDSEPDVCTLVKADLEARIAKGVETYGQRLRTNNGRDPLVDAYQECLDMSLYLRQAIEEIADLRQQLATAQAARERAEGELSEARDEADSMAFHQAGERARWQRELDQANDRLAAAEARLAKVGALAAECREVASHEMGRGARFIDLAYELEAAMKGE